MCSNLKTNTAWNCSVIFIVEFDHSQHTKIVFLRSNLNKYLSAGCERPVAIIWKHKKMIYLFCNKNFKAYFVKQFIVAPNWNELKCSKFAWSWVSSMLTFLLRYNFSPFKHTHNQLKLQKNSAYAEKIVHKKVELQATFFVCLECYYTNLWFSTNQIEEIDKQTKLRWWVIVDQSHMTMLPVWKTV